MAILQGFLFGLGMVIFIGPVFFYLMETAINKGTKLGFAAAIGIYVSDMVAAVLCFAGLSSFFQNNNTQLVFSGLGALVLIRIGIAYLVKKHRVKKVVLSTGNYFAVFTKGFLINFINPFVFLVWITLVVRATETYTSKKEILLHLIFIGFGVIFTDSLKVLLARKIKRFLSVSVIEKIYKIIGIIMIGFGGRLLYHAFSIINLYN